MNYLQTTAKAEVSFCARHPLTLPIRTGLCYSLGFNPLGVPCVHCFYILALGLRFAHALGPRKWRDGSRGMGTARKRASE
jgi:hypothetical protein